MTYKRSLQDAPVGADQHQNPLLALLADDSVKLLAADRWLLGAILSGIAYAAFLAASF